MTRSGSIIKRGKRYHLRYVIGGVQFQIPLNTTSEAQAEKLKERFMRDRQGGLDQYEQFLKGELAQIAKVRDGSTAQNITLAGAWEAFLKSPKRPRAGAGTLSHYKSAWEQFLKLDYPAGTSILDVTTGDASFRMTQLEASGLSQSTVEKHLIYLKAIFGALLPPGYDNPFQGCVARGTHVQASFRPLSDDQLRAILQAAKAEKCRDVYLLTLILAYTGLRLVDAATLLIEEVHFDRNVIVRVPEKTKRYATTRNASTAKIGLHPVLAAEFEACDQADQLSGPILAQVSEWSTARRSEAIQRVFKAAGVEQTVQRAYGRATSVYGASSFRHTLEDRLREAGTAQAVINTILCHSDKTMAAVYSTVRDEEVYFAIRKALPDLTKGTL